MPTTARATVTTLASTYTRNCNACTQVEFNAPSCTAVPQCTLTRAEIVVQAGSSPVHIDTLTGTALYTSVSSALEKLCPTVTQSQSFTACKTGSVAIPKIDYVNTGVLDKGGQLVVKVASSSYKAKSHRDAMIKSAALTAQKGSEGAKSCHNQTYSSIFKRELPASWFFSPRDRFAGYGRDHPEAIEQHGLFCNTAAFAGVQYYGADWRQAKEPGPQTWIDANWEFKVEAGGDFACDFIDALHISLAMVAPEFAGPDAALEPELRAFCEKAFNQDIYH